MTDLLVKLFVKDSGNTSDHKVRERYGTLGSATGIFCNLVLCTIKIIIGSLCASMSIVADGLNNLSDMGSSVITGIGFRLSNKPADSDHPFGHGRFEYVSAFIVSFFILIVGFELGLSAVKALISGEKAPIYSTVSLIVLCISVLVKFWMYIFNKKLSKVIDSSALAATAQDSFNDSLATVAILVAAIVSKFVSLPFNLDAVMALAVAIFILYSGIAGAKETLDSILGNPPSKELIETLEHLILTFDDSFLGIHDLIVHNYGPGREFASVHVEVPQDVDIVDCHEKIDLCEKYVTEQTGIALVIHMDPIDSDNETVNTAKAQMQNALKIIHNSLTLHDFRMTPPAHNRTNLIFDVVVPADVKIPKSELDAVIKSKAKEIDKTYECVITFDDSFI